MKQRWIASQKPKRAEPSFVYRRYSRRTALWVWGETNSQGSLPLAKLVAKLLNQHERKKPTV